MVEFKFLAYCVEIYREYWKLSGKEVAKLFSQYNIWEYIYECFEWLHTTSQQYTIEEIDKQIEKTKSLQA